MILKSVSSLCHILQSSLLHSWMMFCPFNSEPHASEGPLEVVSESLSQAVQDTQNDDSVFLSRLASILPHLAHPTAVAPTLTATPAIVLSALQQDQHGRPALTGIASSFSSHDIPAILNQFLMRLQKVGYVGACDDILSTTWQRICTNVG